MLYKQKTILLFITYYIFSVSAVSTFFNKGDRPEIFELTDNEVAVFRVKLPEEDVIQLKETAKVEGLLPSRYNASEYFITVKNDIRKIVEQINHYALPGFVIDTLAREFPELNIGEDGYPHVNVDEIMKGYDFNYKHYVNFDFRENDLQKYIMKNNPNFNITHISSRIIELELSQNIPQLNTNLTSITELTNNTNTENNPSRSIIINDNNENPSEYYVNNKEETSEYYGNYDEETSEYYGNYEEERIEGVNGNKYFEINEFKTKNGKLTVELAGKEISFDKITFSLGGKYSRQLQKPNFNIKIRGGKNLYGRSHFKLRSDYTEPTYLRSKLTCDIHNRLGLPGIYANYATLYVNDEYMGLFVLVDTYKPSWVEFVYGEKDTPNLYKCNEGSDLSIKSLYTCTNENDDFVNDYTVYSEWNNFLETLEKAESAKDIEDIFEVDYFLYEMAIEYLLGGWDHLQLGHNYSMYKQPNGKWIYLTFDNDHEFGINMDRIFVEKIFDDLPEHYENINTNYPSYSFEEWTQYRHIIDILITRDPTRFNKILKDVVEKVFNPATLFPHIDELKSFIKPYVDKEYTPDDEGHYPGRINTLGNNPYTKAHWDANSEFTSIETHTYNAYGIKYWILAKYRYVCKAYDIECDPTYLDENYEYPINKEVEFKGYFPSRSSNTTIEELSTTSILESTPFDEFDDIYTTTEIETETEITTGIYTSTDTNTIETYITETEIETEIETETITEIYTSTEANAIETPSTVNEVEIETETETPKTLTKTVTLTTSVTSNISSPTETPNTSVENQYKCWAELIGYPCCDPRITKVYDHDEYYGDFGYDFKKQEWCGLTPFEKSTTSDDEECWSEKLGYSCCKGCKVYETDEDGSWGYESNHWCGIPSSCQK